MIIRPGVAADAAHLPAVERSAAAAFGTLPHLAWIVDGPVMPADDHATCIAARTSWVADDGGLPVGFLAASRHGRDLHIDELAVRAECQRQGIGRQLIAAAVDHARDHGIARLTLTTFRDVAWNGHFYATVGFVEANDDPRLADILKRELKGGLPGRTGMALTL